ncbi:MAG: hypothetical protein K6C12_12005 [Oscillospiraceae bacterium]|nr:hypothetical protein [Oscillospiraceae bacterium]
MTEKSREQKLRRAARRQGLVAMKGRSNEGYSFCTGWMIVDANTNFVVCGGSPIPYCLSLEEAESYIYE